MSYRRVAIDSDDWSPFCEGHQITADAAAQIGDLGTRRQTGRLVACHDLVRRLFQADSRKEHSLGQRELLRAPAAEHSLLDHQPRPVGGKVLAKPPGGHQRIALTGGQPEPGLGFGTGQKPHVLVGH